MKRILSFLSVIAMLITMCAAITVPTVAAETANVGDLVNLFDLDTAYPGTYAKENKNYYTSDYIEIKAGDTFYFGINDTDESLYQIALYKEKGGTVTQVKSLACTKVEIVTMPNSSRTWAIMSHTIPEGFAYARFTCRSTYADQYLLTKNQSFTKADWEAYYTSPVTNIYVEKKRGIWQKDGTVNDSTAHYSSELIEVAAGDKIYFGPCNVNQGFQLYHWEGTENFNTSTIIRHGNEALSVCGRFPAGQVIYCYTAPSKGRIGLCNAPAYNNFYCITKNEVLTTRVYKRYVNSINRGARVLYDTSTITNIFTPMEPQGFYQKDGTIKSSSSHYSGELIDVYPGDVIYFGPVNLNQNFHLYDWAGTEGFPAPFKLGVTDVQKYVVDTFPNGQAILAYEATETGRVGLVNATAYNDIFVATLNVPMDVESYYAYFDAQDNRKWKYSELLGRYNEYEVKDSVLNGKTALFCGDSITIAYGDDDYFNDRSMGGWAGRVKMYYGMERVVNNGVSGSSLSTTRDAKAGRISWQVAKEADYQYDYVILHGGVNDAWDSAPVGTVSDSFELEDFDLDTYAGGLEATLYYATKYHPNAAIGYLINFEAPYKKTGKIPTMGDDYFPVGKQICEKWGIPYLDLCTILNKNTFDTKIYTYDNIHPNALGYNAIAPYVGDWMETLKPYGQTQYEENDKTVIACVGDSLTKGEQGGDINRYTYPAYLQEMLGEENYKVMNFGWGGAAAQPTASNTYKATVQYKDSMQANPDQVIIMLGTNDSRTDNNNWDASDHAGSCAKYKAALKALAEEYINLPSNPTVYLATPPYINRSAYVTIYNDGGLLAAVREVASELNIQLIDTYTPTDGRTDLFAEGDTAHFSAAGYELIAGEMYKAITNSATAPDVLSVTEKNTAVEETDTTKPLIRNWKAYYETADAFRIETVEDVEIFGDLISVGYTFAGKTVYLEKDLDFTGIDFKPLGASTGKSGEYDDYRFAFAGTFDGQNHVFSNVNISSNYYYTALFPLLNGATIRNFGMNGGYVEGYTYVASIAALGFNSAKLQNVWSSADVYSAYRGGYAAGIIGYMRQNDATADSELINVAYYGKVDGTAYVAGICSNSGNATIAKNLVFDGTIHQRAKNSGQTPFIVYGSTPVVGETGGWYTNAETEIKNTYAEETPVILNADDTSSGKLASDLNAQSETPVWTMKYGYAVPFADENNKAPYTITKDAVSFYTDYAGQPVGFSLADGSFWYLNGVLTAVADMPALKDGDVLGVAISPAGADFDNSGSITTADAIMLLRYIDGHRDSEMNDTMADVNADGKVKIFDVVRLLQVIRDLPV